jgi:hypothetical protein
MKTRHAAALALVGWYLMAPLSLQTNLPISEWNHIGSYDKATDCEDGRVALAEKNKHDPQKYRLILLSECIASDDPRLKEK